MKKAIYIVLYLTLDLLAVSCSLEDDINEIFVSKTWYMTGGRLNSQDLNKDVKNFYSDAGRNAYNIHFVEGKFTGTLSTGLNFEGRWNVNPKTQDLSLVFTKEPNVSETFDHNIYSVLKNIKYYEGDSNYLILYSDKNNFIRLNNER